MTLSTPSISSRETSQLAIVFELNRANRRPPSQSNYSILSDQAKCNNYSYHAAPIDPDPKPSSPRSQLRNGQRNSRSGAGNSETSQQSGHQRCHHCLGVNHLHGSRWAGHFAELRRRRRKWIPTAGWPSTNSTTDPATDSEGPGLPGQFATGEPTALGRLIRDCWWMDDDCQCWCWLMGDTMGERGQHATNTQVD